VWFERRGPFENQDLAWASDRIAMLQQMVENSGRVVAVDRRST
jgi:nicotinic acid mononucleotide adenylyltransferase